MAPGVQSGPESAAPVGLSGRVRALLFFLALALRLGALAELRGTPWNEVLLGDAQVFDGWGLEIAGGHWIGERVFYQAPLYPYLLGLVYAVLGHVPDAVRLLQCLLGALSAVWIASATVRFGSRGAGLAAGLGCALYGPLVWYDVQIEKTSLACSLTAGLLLLVVGGTTGTTRTRPLAAGVLLAALTLLRENAAVLVLPLGWTLGRERAGRGRRLGLFLVGLLLGLLPVAARNLAVGGAPLPTASNAGVNFYIGNAVEADGMYRPLVPGRGHPEHEREDATRIAQSLSGEELSAAGVSLFWFRLACREIAEDPGHFLGLVWRKTRLLAHHGEIMDACSIEVFEDASLVLRALRPFGFGVLLPLALAGAAIARRRRGAGWPLAAAAVLALSVLAFFVVGRFRLGLVPLLLPFAGIALAEGARSPRRGAVLLAGVAGAVLAWWPLALEGDPRATSDSNLASELVRLGRDAEAEPWARQARERDPSSAEAAFNLGLVLRKLGRGREALEHFRAAMELEPAYASDCLAERGAILGALGDLEGARAELERALALDPEHEAARIYLRELEVRERAR